MGENEVVEAAYPTRPAQCEFQASHLTLLSTAMLSISPLESYRTSCYPPTYYNESSDILAPGPRNEKNDYPTSRIPVRNTIYKHRNL